MGANRREFLKLAGAAGAAAIAGAQSADAAPVRRISGDWLGMLTDLSLCIGCRQCEWACRKANGLAPDEPVILEHLADAYIALGDLVSARIYYLRAIHFSKDEEQIKSLME